MKGWVFVVAALLIAAGGWAIMTFRSVPDDVAGLQQRLPSEEALNAMPLDETVEALKRAEADCRRVGGLAANPLALYLRGAEIKSLSESCDLIKARQEALSGP